MVESVQAFKASDGTLYDTEVMAMRRETHIAMQGLELGNGFTLFYERCHNSPRLRKCLYTLVEWLRRLHNE